MKYRSKDFGKTAWATRVTAPVIKVDLVIQCKNLPKKDCLSQADSFCVLWHVPNGHSAALIKEHGNGYNGGFGNGGGGGGIPAKLPGRQEIEKGRTEVARACVDPTFKHKFRLEFTFHEEQSYVIRVYDEDLRYATDLKEHDYLGGCTFTLGQLMGAKGCALARKLLREKSYMVVTGEEIIETREVMEFRFSCQDLIKEQNLIDQSKVLEKCNPYFRLERLNKDDQSWEVVWKSEVVKDSLSPTWNESRIPLQLLCNDDQQNSIKITVWDYEKHSSSHDQMGYVETSVAELVAKSKEGIPVFMVMREKKKWFGGSKPKPVGLLKVLKSSVIRIPSMLQYLSGGCSLDLIVGIDCTTGNGPMGTEKCLHYAASHWLNDYQAGIQKLGSIVENFARGKHSSMWGFGATIRGEYKDKFIMRERLTGSRELLEAYEDNIVDNSFFDLGKPALLKPLIQVATFRTIRSSKKRQCYSILCIFTAGDVADLQETINLICTAAEDAPISIVIIGVGNRDFSEVKKLLGDDTGVLLDSRKIPITRQNVSFVTFKRFAGNASEVIAEALKDIPEQFVQYQISNGIKPLPTVPPPDFESLSAAAAMAKKSSSSRNGPSSSSSSKKNGNSRSISPRRNTTENGKSPSKGSGGRRR